MRGIKNVFIDIETYGGSNKPSIEDIPDHGGIKNPEKQLAYKTEKLKSAWSQQALDVLKSEVICVGYAIDDGELVSIIGTEQEIVKELEIAMPNEGIRWVGHNILGFDLPILSLRALKYNTPTLYSLIPKRKGELLYCDTMQEFSGTLYGRDAYLSLKNLCSFFGIKAKDGMDGSMVHDAFVEGKIKEIAEYCLNDVSAVRELYYILKR